MTSPKAPRRVPTGQIMTATAVLADLIASSSTGTLAAARVEGKPDAVRVEASDSTVAEVLSALGAAFDLRYRTSAPLDRPLTLVYKGPLRQLLARVLDGYNFVVKTSSGEIEVVVLGAATGTPSPAVAAAAPMATPARPAPPPPKPAPTTGANSASTDVLELIRRSIQRARR